MVELRGEDRDEELEARVLGQGGFLLVRCVRRDPQAAGRDRVGPAPALACRSFPTAASDTSAPP
jgi:hypothetical protein